MYADIFGIRIIHLVGYDAYYEEGGEDTRVFFAENLEKDVQYTGKYYVLKCFVTMETSFMDTVGKAMANVYRMIRLPSACNRISGTCPTPLHSTA